MSTFNINTTITVPGVRNSGEAINEIRVMLRDYEDNNPEHGKHISIQVNDTDEAVAADGKNETFIDNSRNALAHIKKNTLRRIADILEEKGIDHVHAADVSDGESPIIIDDHNDGNLTYTLDSITVRNRKRLYIEIDASNCCDNTTVNAEALDAGLLLDVLEWLTDNEDDLGTQPE